MGVSYFPRNELKEKLGLSEPALLFLQKLSEFIDTQTELAEAQVVIADQGDAIDDANTDITALNGAVNTLDGRIDAYDLLAPFVRQNQAANPAHTPFAGVTASNPPTQAEVQAISDGLVSQSTTIAGLRTALDTINALTP
jgi:hypothetical protein